VVGQKMSIHLHVKNSGYTTPKVNAVCAPIWVTITPGAETYQKRKEFEDSLWQQMLKSGERLSSEPVQIPPGIDYWFPLETANVLTQEQIDGLKHNQTVYFMGRVTDLAGTVLLEFCARTGTDTNTMLFCLDHNGP
jgi:hypothetical protein